MAHKPPSHKATEFRPTNTQSDPYGFFKPTEIPKLPAQWSNQKDLEFHKTPKPTG